MSTGVTDPGRQLFLDARREFGQVLDRIEMSAGKPQEYGPIEYAADFAIAGKFLETWWEQLTEGERRRYNDRVKYLKTLFSR